MGPPKKQILECYCIETNGNMVEILAKYFWKFIPGDQIWSNNSSLKWNNISYTSQLQHKVKWKINQ